jgi:hypothetical protein
MARGDLLSIPCIWGVIPYRHFGIDIGDGTVVHLATVPNARSTMQVQRVTLAEFSGGKMPTVETVSDCLPPESVVAQALNSVGTTYYHLVVGNCEHFARHCKSGNHASHQSDRLVRGVLRAVMAGLVTTSTRVASEVAIAGLPRILMTKPAGISTLVGEAARHSAYIVSRCGGIEHKHAERIGKSAGVATATMAGSVAGGPIGGATAAALYLAIDAISQAAFKSFEANKRSAPNAPEPNAPEPNAPEPIDL